MEEKSHGGTFKQPDQPEVIQVLVVGSIGKDGFWIRTCDLLLLDHNDKSLYHMVCFLKTVSQCCEIGISMLVSS